MLLGISNLGFMHVQMRLMQTLQLLKNKLQSLPKFSVIPPNLSHMLPLTSIVHVVQCIVVSLEKRYFLVTALGKMQKMDTALQAVDLSWGGQLSLGATTFWEVYQ